MLRTSNVAFAALALAWSLTLTAPVLGQDGNFSGKNVTLYIGFGAGGGYDLVGRIAARHLGKHLRGNPTVIPKNMPGAGSFLAANFIFNAAPKDGTAIGLFTQGLSLQETLAAPGIQFESGRFNWIGRITSSVEVLATSRRLKTIADAREQEFFMAGSGPGSPSETFPMLMNALAGTKFKIISGYPGSGVGFLAMARGEINGTITAISSVKQSKAEELKAGEINIFVQYAPRRHPNLPDVPAVVEFATSDRGRAILEFYTSTVEVGYALAAPPGVPADRVKTLREGFASMLKDPEFIAEFERMGSDLDPASGEAVGTVIAKMQAAPADIINETKEILGIK